MAKTASFTKRALITKANSTMVYATAIAAFLVVFSAVASKALISQATYQNRVISVKKKALATLNGDLNAVNSLKESYQSFVGTPRNVLGGNPTGTGDQDGDNAKIVLDALPSKYDFPALATSLEKLINSQGLQIQGITGTDDELAQAANKESTTPQPISVPFQVRVTGGYDATKNLLSVFERSIRPVQITKVEVSGDKGGTVTTTIDAKTFYQPEKSLKIQTQVVK
ncbi:MAG: type 4a pilus biogenesis protein PilO [Candidatus Saccharimonadales bacterium]